MQKRKKRLQYEPKVDIMYFVVSIILILNAVIFIALSNGEAFKYLYWHGTTLGIYPDLFESIIQARTKDPYSFEAIYPALVYCMLYPFNFFIPGAYSGSIGELTRFCKNSQAPVISHIFFAEITVAIAYLILKLYGEKRDIKKYFIIFIFFFSTPFIFMIERGNTVIITIAFLLGYFAWYKSENKRLREFALICLTIAAVMKIYPVVFGLLLLADKRVRDAIHAIIYGLIAFIVPFFFMGGLGKIPVMFQNAFTLNANSVSGSTGFGYGFKVNATSTVAAIFNRFSNNIPSTEIKAFVYVLMALLVISSLLIKTEWKRIAALCLVVILMPDFSFIYNVSYLIIPLVIYIRDCGKEKLTVKNFIYTACFVGAFAPLPYGEFLRSLGGYNKMNWSTLVSSLSLLVLSFMIAGEGVKQLFKLRKKKLTAVALAGSVAFGFVPVLLSNL